MNPKRQNDKNTKLHQRRTEINITGSEKTQNPNDKCQADNTIVKQIW